MADQKGFSPAGNSRSRIHQLYRRTQQFLNRLLQERINPLRNRSACPSKRGCGTSCRPPIRRSKTEKSNSGAGRPTGRTSLNLAKGGLSGIRESDPCLNLGKVAYCHYTNPAFASHSWLRRAKPARQRRLGSLAIASYGLLRHSSSVGARASSQFAKARNYSRDDMR